MIFKTFDNSNQNIKYIDDFIKEGKDVFILIFMHGCGPCNATRPEWDKIKKILENKYKNNNNILVVDVNKDYIKDLPFIGDIDGFPTIKFISKKGKLVENYENASISNKDRSARSFVEWIESTISTSSSFHGGTNFIQNPYTVLKRLTGNLNKTKNKKAKKRVKSKKGKKTRKKSKKNKNFY